VINCLADTCQLRGPRFRKEGDTSGFAGFPGLRLSFRPAQDGTAGCSGRLEWGIDGPQDDVDSCTIVFAVGGNLFPVQSWPVAVWIFE